VSIMALGARFERGGERERAREPACELAWEPPSLACACRKALREPSRAWFEAAMSFDMSARVSWRSL
jgi:hypothetical protein